jgi:hypothetical protein
VIRSANNGSSVMRRRAWQPAFGLFGGIVFQFLILMLLQASAFWAEAYEIDAPLDGRTRQQVAPVLERLQVNPERVRVAEFMNVTLVRIEARKYCAVIYCLTFVLNSETGAILTSALLPTSFSTNPNIFIEGTRSVVFGKKQRTYLVIGPHFAAVLLFGGD